MSDIQKTRKNSHVVSPSGKPMLPHLLCCQGIGGNYYSLTLDAFHLRHPRLLQRHGDMATIKVFHRKKFFAIVPGRAK